MVPWCDREQTSRKLGALCADKIAEDRIIQIARADPPDDLMRFRRLIMQLHADVGWSDVAEFLFYWGARKKRQLVEDYYISRYGGWWIQARQRRPAMNERNFVNFHVLISHSPSCLNRDDMNMQGSR